LCKLGRGITVDEEPNVEICDVFDGAGTRTGRTVVRGVGLPRGEYYLVVQVWIRNEAGGYLIQQRARPLASGPGVWAPTAGYVLAGGSSISGAIREVEEELGVRLPPAYLRRFDRLETEDRLEDLWPAEVPEERLGAPTLGPEVAGWRWATKDELRHMMNRGDFFAYSYFERLPV
jgi:8-oxo-dGTP pyrophosphatase MutT (NUDIX family)